MSQGMAEQNWRNVMDDRKAKVCDPSDAVDFEVKSDVATLAFSIRFKA